jgi:hypothetical protein
MAMADDLIPAEVRDFIHAYVQSIADLEALLLLARNSDAKWSAASVARQLYIEEAQAAEVLERLCAGGLARCQSGTFWFNDAPAGQRAIVEQLADIYSQHLIPVTNLVHSRPSGARAFAAAFKFRKDR